MAECCFNPLDHPVLFSSPQRLTPFSAWHEHIPFAFFLVDLLRPNVLVELGTHYGDSYCAFCQAIQELNLLSRCYAIDTWEGDPQSGSYGLEVLEDLRGHHNPIYGSFSTLIKSTFDDALNHFSDGSIDLLHIDGYHTYGVVRHDFESWLPKMSSCGIVLFHDTNVRERDFGVWRFWEEIKASYPHFEFVHGHGLGVLGIGKQLPEKARTLFNTSLEEILRIRNVFFQLGQGIVLKAEQRAQLVGERERFRQLQSMIESQEQVVAEKEQEIVQLQGAIDSQKTIMLQLLAEREQLLETVTSQRDTLAAIETSLSWKLVTNVRKVKETLLPVDTTRRLAYDRVLFRIKTRDVNSVNPLVWVNKGGSAATLTREPKKRFLPLRVLLARTNVRKLFNHLRVFGMGYTWRKVKKKIALTSEFGYSEAMSTLPYVLTSDNGEIEHVVRLPTIRSYRVMFLVGCLEFESKRYRVFNLIEALNLVKIEADYCFDIDISSKLSHILSFDLLVLFRTGWSENIAALIGKARRINLPIVYDADDYVFDPSILDYVDGIRGWDSNALKEYKIGVLRYRKTLDRCDYFTGPTRFLMKKAATLGKKAYLIPNTLNDKQLQISESASAYKRNSVPRTEVVIGYFSGTRTHQKDFGVACSALVRILAEYDHVSLKIVGFLNVAEFPALEAFAQRVVEIPFVHWERLPHQIADVDINIIPLEMDNPFCDAKSELKYFEAGIVGVPSLASATKTYKEVIRHGHNGLLAYNSEQWYEGLKSLVLDKPLRDALGTVAYADATKNYTTRQRSTSLRSTYENIIRDSRKTSGFDDDALSIIFVVPAPEKGSGGHKDIFLLANQLQNLGNRVVLFFTPDNGFDSPDRLRNFIASEFCDPKFGIVIGSNVFSCDALIATHYTTAELVKSRAKLSVGTFYFVQDYEPLFNPMGADFISAERTYKFGFQHITLGSWLKAVLSQKYEIRAETIPFWIEKEIYFPRHSIRKPKVAFLARPEMPRRCFNLGLQALKIFHERNPEIEIVLFGSPNIQHYSVPFRHIDVGVLSKLSLAELYSEISLGLAFSTTNPSFVAYEMMACGCPVVDVQLDPDYDYLKYGSSQNALLVEPDAEQIANLLEEALRDEARRNKVAENGLKFVESFPDIKRVGCEFEQILKRVVSEKINTPSWESEVEGPSCYPWQFERSHCPSCDGLQSIPGEECLQFVDRGKRYVLQCERCGFMFLAPRLPEGDIPALEDESEYKKPLNPQKQIDALQGVAEFIEQFKPARGKCLEIGCGNGVLLKALQTRGWRVLGNEISKVAVRNATDLGVEVLQGKLEEVNLPLSSFDVVILWHVLEHIYAPRDFLVKIKDILKRDGLIVLQVPDFNRIDSYRHTNRIKELLCAVHVNYFTVDTLTRLAENAGWAVHYTVLDDHNFFITAVLGLSKKIGNSESCAG